MEAAAEDFANAGGATALTGTWQQLAGQLGGRQDALVAAYQVLEKQAQSLLQKARSGAVLNEIEIRQLEKSFPPLPQIKLENGNLAKSTRTRFKTLKFVLESEHAGMFDRPQRQNVKKAIEREWDSVKSESFDSLIDSTATPDPQSRQETDQFLKQNGFGLSP